MNFKALRWIVGFHLLLSFDASADRRYGPNDVIVMHDSKYVRQLYAQTATADPFPILVARQSFEFAGDQKAVKALDEYLARVGLLALAGEVYMPSGTLERLITDPAALPSVPDGLLARILSTSLTPRLAVPENAEDRLPSTVMNSLTHKQESPSVWSSWNNNQVEYIHVFVLAENTGKKRITQFEARLRIDPVDNNNPIDLKCIPETRLDNADIAPGQGWLHRCFVEAERVAIPEIVNAVRTLENDPSRWRFVPTRIAFLDPPVSVGANGVYHWHNVGDASLRANANIIAAGCTMTGSCSEQLYVKFRSDPRYSLIPSGALIGIFLGWLVARASKRPYVAGAAVSLLLFVWEFVMLLGVLQNSVFAFFLGLYSLYAIVPFLITFWLTVSALRILRGRAVSTHKQEELAR